MQYNNLFSETLLFCRFNMFYEHFKLYTPMAKKLMREPVIYTGKKQLEEIYGITESFIKFASNNNKLSLAQGRLSGITNADFNFDMVFTAEELFSLKQLLANAKALYSLLGQNIAGQLGFEWRLDNMLNLLNKGGGDTGGFYIDNIYDSRLEKIRARTAVISQQIQTIITLQNEQILKKHNINFSFGDFAIVNAEQIQKLKNLSYLFCEPYDNDSFIVKPVYGDKYLDLLKQRRNLVHAEQEICKDVLLQITKEARKVKTKIENAVNFVISADIYLAKAALALKFNMRRPEINCKNISVKNGIYYPLQSKTGANAYTPVTANFDKNLAVITGSNMGGKTEILRSLAFFQLLAQSGFFVPASEFKTKIFKHIHYLGEDREKTAGLSSFGLDVYNFVTAFSTSNEPSLYFIDEFARTTNTVEAKALINAILEVFAANKNVYAFFTTHFSDIKQNKGIMFCRMAGLKHEEFKKYITQNNTDTLQNRLKAINKFMRFNIAPHGSENAYDAVSIAVALGLDKNITGIAVKELEHEN